MAPKLILPLNFTKEFCTVDSEIFALSLFREFSISELFAKFLCGQSFRLIETKHPKIRFPNRVENIKPFLIIFDVPNLIGIVMSSSL